MIITNHDIMTIQVTIFMILVFASAISFASHLPITRLNQLYIIKIVAIANTTNTAKFT